MESWNFMQGAQLESEKGIARILRLISASLPKWFRKTEVATPT
jgi:hypothetical protein